ncbi:MAG: GMC family oxidoreductase, partial [Burkholderiales bacterium]|nr:GMC family oxidoreductase [Burkholderiales bacterium]
MRRIAEPVDRLLEAALAGPFDVAVVGSGYGGAVAARRCAEAGLSVVVLERGKEYLPGEFPRETAAAPAHFRIDVGGDTTLGYDDALYDVHVGPEMVVVAGSGLGGGSLVNAGVALAPERGVFAQARWPTAIRDNIDDLLARYAPIRAELAAMPYAHDATGAVPAKTLAFEAFARCARNEARPVPITVNTSPRPIPLPGGALQPCIGCGDCVAGCNYGAKATLGMTYLAAAHDAGARLFTNACVLQVAPHAQGWQVALTRTTDQRSYQRALAREATATNPAERAALRELQDSLTLRITARVVILAAGALGSTEILQRSREAGLGVSRTLGTRFSGNGDSLSFGYWQRDPVHAVGWGSNGNQDTPGPQVVGPTITRAVHAGDGIDVNRHFVVEDAAIPGVLAGIFHEIVTNASILHQLDGWSFKGADPLALTEPGAQHTQTFLTMGHDGSRGELRYGTHGRIRVHWPTLDADTPARRYDDTLSAVTALGATYIPNPLGTPVPRSLEWALAGVRSGGHGVTVHPLGGCPMGDDGAVGVVDDKGGVFLASGTTRTHPGLYVLDGAIVPTSLGTNPFLTIAVLAERAMPAVIKYVQSCRGDRQAGRGPQPPAVVLPIPALAVCPRTATSLTFHEVLRGELTGAEDGQAYPLAARLDVALPTTDVAAFLADPHHRLEAARARLQLSPIGPRPRLQSTWHYEEAQGLVTIMEPVARALPLRVLDTLQVLATLVIERAADEVRQRIARKLADCLLALARVLRGQRTADVVRRPERTPAARTPGPIRLLILVLRLAWHAADRRQMRYEFAFRLAPDAGAAPDGDAARTRRGPREVLLSGRKDIRYAADWSALATYARRWLVALPWRLLYAFAQLVPALRERIGEPARPRLVRRNVWRTMTELRIRLAEPSIHRARIFASGTLAMAPLEVRDERPPQIHGETTAGLLGVAGYGALFARYLLKCRLFDFRLPDYRPLPDFPYARASGDGAASRVHFAQRLPLLRDEQGMPTLIPECHALDVPRRAGSSEQVELVLWRYRNKVEFRDTRDGMRQARSILLVHAFGQSAVSFAEPTQDVNLAEFLHRRGWDVWLVEHRISSGLPSAAQQCNMDEIARFDLPMALRRCLREIEREHPEASGRPLQMFAVAQCVGAASLAMSILGGELAAGGVHAPTAALPEHVGYQSRHRSLLAGVVLSQFTPYVIGDAGAQFRTFLPPLLRDATHRATVRFDAPADVPCAAADANDGDDARENSITDPLTTLLDRFLATLPRDADEHCWDEYQGRAATQVHASCRRMSGIEAPLFAHRQLSRATHDRLPLLLGTANLGVFLHARHCVEQERLVDADGLNIYVTEGNIQRHLHMPVAFAHGRRNALFSVGSSRRSYLMLGNI